MVKKRISKGIILVLLMLVLGGCQTGGISKDVVYSQKQKSADGIETASRNTASIQQAEAVEKAKAAFRKYLNIQNIDKSLDLKAALIEGDGVLWMNPYWQLSWVSKDAKKPTYSAEIDAQSGEVVRLLHREKLVHRVISREDVLAYQNTALAFIDKFDLVNKAPLSIFEAYSSKTEGIEVVFRYGTDKFITLSFNGTGDITGFRRTQRVGYSLQGNDLEVNRTEAIKIAQASIKHYFGDVDTSKLIEDILLVEGHKGEKTWFVHWHNIAPLEGRYVTYGAQVSALSGKVVAVEGVNHSFNKSKQEINNEKLREIADQYLQQKNLSDYSFEAFDKDLASLCYRNKVGSPLHVFVDRSYGTVDFISFGEFK
jgi:hypothetical protein